MPYRGSAGLRGSTWPPSGGPARRGGRPEHDEVRRLGNSGLVVSVVGLGCNTFVRMIHIDDARAVVDAALDAGITCFAAANIYGAGRGESEPMLGAVLKGRRDDVVVATKFGMSPALRQCSDVSASSLINHCKIGRTRLRPRMRSHRT